MVYIDIKNPDYKILQNGNLTNTVINFHQLIENPLFRVYFNDDEIETYFKRKHLGLRNAVVYK